jgi:hypothetical protein
MWNGTNFTFHHQHGVQYFTAEPDESPIDVEVIMETEDLVCHPYSVLYQVNITHPKGVQSFVHAMDDWQPLGYPERDNSGLLELYGMDFDTDDMNPWPWPESGRDMSSYPEEAKVFAQDAREMLPQFNEFAIVDSLMAQLQIDTADGVNPEACTQEFKLANGTNAFECSWDPNQRGSNNSDGGMYPS